MIPKLRGMGGRPVRPRLNSNPSELGAILESFTNLSWSDFGIIVAFLLQASKHMLMVVIVLISCGVWRMPLGSQVHKDRTN
jgi:hypothetical protein